MTNEFVKLSCPACGSAFSFASPKASYQLESRDPDFCPHYKGINPLFYQVRVCPSCFFSSFEDDWHELSPEERIAMLSLAREAKSNSRFDWKRPERTLFAATKSFQLALRCYEKRQGYPIRIRGDIQHKLAWLCRYGKDLKRENTHQELARALYIESYRLERDNRKFPFEEARIAYLIGELSRRTGHGEEAVDWLLKALQTKDRPREIYHLCKEQLYEAKESIRFFHYLQGVDFLRALDVDQLAPLASHLSSVCHPEGTVICKKGDPGKSLHIIVQGAASVHLTPGAQAVATLMSGDFFGEISLLTGQPCSATVILAQRSELIEIDRLAFRTMLAYNPEVAETVSRVIASRQAQNERYFEERQKPEEALLEQVRHHFELE